MLIALVVMWLLGWVVVQASSERRAKKWRGRFASPVVLYFLADVAATWTYLRSFRLRDLLNPRWWRERLQFREVWRSFDL